MSDTTLNEMWQMFALAIQGHIITEAAASNYFGLTADEQRTQAVANSFIGSYSLLMMT